MAAPKNRALAFNRVEERATDDRLMTALEVKAEVCQDKVSKQWVIDHYAARYGTKPGREWLFPESEVRLAWADTLRKRRLSK